MSDAVRVWANDHATAEEKDRRKHALTLFEIVRDYRNFYVHGITGGFGVPEGDGVAWATAMKTTAKTRYTVASTPVSVAELKAAYAHCSTLSKYLNGLFHYFWTKTHERQRIGDHVLRRDPLPDKPPPPDKLKMTLLGS